MLCSKCYKRIPEGEEVKRGSGGVYWQAGGWWSNAGGRGGTFCLRCAKIEDKREKRAWKTFTILFFGMFLFMLLTWIIIFVVKKSA